MKGQPNFKKGEEIFFIEANTPKKAKVEGIAIYSGRCKSVSVDKDIKEGEMEVVYFVGAYTIVEEQNAFKTKEDLQQSLFAAL